MAIRRINSLINGLEDLQDRVEKHIVFSTSSGHTHDGSNSRIITGTDLNEQSASYIISKSGSTIKAKNGSTGVISYSGTNAYTAITTAINTLTSGGKILIKSGVYDCGNNIITHKEGVYLQGEIRGYWDDNTTGTVIICSGIDCSNLNDFGIYELKLCASVADTGTGILLGTTNVSFRPKFLKLSRIKLYNFATGILGQNIASDDTTLFDCYINDCTTGIAGLSSMIKIFGGAITHCDVGINMYHVGTIVSSHHLFGTVFSTNGIDIKLTGSLNINETSFYGCWFEAEVTGILKIDLTVAFAVPNLLFSNCSLNAGGTYLFDLRGTNFVRCVLDGGSLGIAGTVFVDSNTLFESRKVYGEENITINGTGGTTFSRFQEKNIVSDPFAIDSLGIKTITVPHGLSITPAWWECSLTVIQNTAVDDWGYNLLKFVSVDATNVTAKINVSTASATVGATARLGIRVGNP